MVSNSPHTPAMQQYLAAKHQHPDALLFFRMGDFYELFFEDAIEAARLLELTLTSRNKNDDNPVPMAGVPYHAAKGYVQRLVEFGKKVAICEQMENPADAKGVVRREVTHVVTPGLQLDVDTLDARAPNYLAAIEEGIDGLGLAYADVTTGQFFVTLAPDMAALLSELLRVEPREIVAQTGFATRQAELLRAVDSALVSPRPDAFFDAARARRALGEAAADTLSPSALTAAGALIAYVEQMHPAARQGLGAPEAYALEHTMGLEETTLANLEISRTLMTGRRKGSLLGLLDRTRTGMGGRTLRRWLQYPLLEPKLIDLRLDAVQALRDDTIARSDVSDHLVGVYDIERLCGRVQAGVAAPRDLAALRASLSKLPALRAVVAGCGDRAMRRLAQRVDLHEDVLDDLTRTLVDEPPVQLKDGGLIRVGVDPDLDELMSLSRDGKSWLLRYEAEQRKQTGIPSLKVGFNKVFGYYLEVTKANLELVPSHYFRKQTLANAERYFTDELKSYEEKILTADERRIALEIRHFEQLRDRMRLAATALAPTARAVAEIDVFCALATVAHERRYCRPTLDRSKRLDIEAGRHPVIEAMIKDEAFVPNDVILDADADRLLLITGPNMAGKSTVMRQVALTVLMAQMGSFVPADRAHIGIVDRIFTRVGASDNLSRGQSTFMVEMTETAHILRRATPRSLLLLDEIGRGTSTFDGVSIAWATAEHIHDAVRARTLFATHYHELVELAQSRNGIRNMHIAVKEWNDDIVFLRKLVPGGTNRSYGIQVGRLAGLPTSVVQRAKEVLAGLEAGHLVVHAPGGRAAASAGRNQLSLFTAGPPSGAATSETATSATASAGAASSGSAPASAPAAPPEMVQVLRDVALDTLTPIEALNTLYRLKALLPPAGRS